LELEGDIKKMNPKKITNLLSKKAEKVKPTDILICCFCSNTFIASEGYDYSFCCDSCCLNQESLNKAEGRT